MSIQKRYKVYVGNLPFSANEKDIRELFSGFVVKGVSIVYDRETQRSKGFAFVELGDAEEVKEAIVELDQAELGGRRVVVNEARERAVK